MNISTHRGREILELKLIIQLKAVLVAKRQELAVTGESEEIRINSVDLATWN